MKKRLLIAAVCVSMIASLAGCSGSGGSAETGEASVEENTDAEAAGGEETADSGGGYTIGFSNFSLTDSWRVQMEAEFEYHAEQLKEQGVIDDYVMLQANGDQSKQISDISDLITMGCDAIVVTCITPDGLNSIIEEARNEGIVVVNFNQSCTAEVDCRVVVSDYELGYTSGSWLGERIPENGKVVVLDGTEGNQINADRHNGGVDGLMEACPTAEVIATLNLDWDYATAKAAMEDILSAYPEIDGILSQGGAMTQAAIDAYIDAGRDFVLMTGEASNGFLRVWLENEDKGLETMAFTNPTYISAIALDYAIDILNGEEVEQEIVLEEDPVTIDTAADFYREDLNDNFWVHTYLPDDILQELFPN